MGGERKEREEKKLMRGSHKLVVDIEGDIEYESVQQNCM
jgi:hypothetical protein